jgi:hypothetical protein
MYSFKKLTEMNLKPMAGLCMAFMLAVTVGNAQQTPTPPPTATTPPTSDYSYHESFGPPFYTKNGTEFRAADGQPGPKYWQNRADYVLAAKLDDKTNEITGSEVLTYTNNSPQNLGFLWMQLDQNLFKLDSRGTAIVPPAGSRNWGRGEAFEAGYKIKSVKAVDAKGVATDVKFLISDTRMQVFLPKGGNCQRRCC